MGPVAAPDPSLIPGVHFVYRDASGTEHQITGQAQVGSIVERTWLRYGVIVRPVDRSSRGNGRFFNLRSDWRDQIADNDDPFGGDASLYWWHALRRFAVEQTMTDLDLGGLSQEPFVVEPNMHEVLKTYGLRTCVYLPQSSNGTPHCGADASGDDTTTLADCAKCPVPDEWEMCGHVSRVKTRAIPVDGGWGGRRLLGGICQLGRKSARGVPVGCRGGTDEQPSCFHPRTVESPKSSESYSDTELEDRLSAVNVEWNKRHGFPLFTLVSLQPLQHLRGGCTNAAEFHTRVGGVSELLAKLNEGALRDMLSPSAAPSLQSGHTLAVLEAVLGKLGYPHGESVIADLRTVQRLRDLPPTHPPDQGGARAIEALRKLGVQWPVGRHEWPQAWERARARLARGLQALLDDLRSAT